MRPSRILYGVAALTLALSSPATATDVNRLTYVTFSGPVQVPGVTLPAGTYRFELADSVVDRSVLEISNQDGTKHYAMLLTMPIERLNASDEPIVLFKETARREPVAVQAWFYPGERAGQELVYPHDQAMRIAKATRQAVLSASTTSTARGRVSNKARVTRVSTVSHR
jgi:hypothetical protein